MISNACNQYHVRRHGLYSMVLAKSTLSSLAFASAPPKQRLVDHLNPIFISAGSDSVADIGASAIITDSLFCCEEVPYRLTYRRRALQGLRVQVTVRHVVFCSRIHFRRAPPCCSCERRCFRSKPPGQSQPFAFFSKWTHLRHLSSSSTRAPSTPSAREN